MNGIRNEEQLVSHSFPEDGLDLKKIVEQLRHNLRLILSVAIGACFIALLYTFTIVPQYQSTALVRIKSSSNNTNLLSSMGYKPNTESPIDTQIALLRSRFILEPIVNLKNLNIQVTPHYFPLFGAWIARRHGDDSVASPFLGLTSYAWGGEKIELKTFSLSEIGTGKIFKLIAKPNHGYALYSGKTLLLEGKAGEVATADGLQVEFSTINARPGTEFTIKATSPFLASATLSHKLRIINIMGNDMSQPTGIAQLQFIGNNPQQVADILNSIIRYAVEKNIAQKRSEAIKTIEFLNQRLPELKNNLDAAETAISQYHIQTNTLNMALNAQFISQRLSMLTQLLEKIRSQKQELLQTYTAEHPVIISLEHKEAEVKNQLDNIQKKIQQFPPKNQEEYNLNREAKIKNSLYVSLLNNKQQQEINKAGLISDISILAYATPAMQMPAYKLVILLMSFLAGLSLASIFVILKAAISKTIENSDQVEDEFKIPVQTVLPYSRKQKQLSKAHEKGLNTFGTALSAPLILAKIEPDDITIESLRSLRVSLTMTTPEHSCIAMMGSVASIGKSFVSLNLAQIFSDTGKRTLLIDADIRKGRLHHTLHQQKANGLSEYLEGNLKYSHLIRSVSENLFYISSGIFKTHPIQLFQSPRFAELIQLVKKEFDQVIIDTPPVIPVSDALIIAQQCDVNLFVVSAGKDTLKEVGHALKKAKNHHVHINGLVLNHSKPLASNAHYQYKYAYAEKATL